MFKVIEDLAVADKLWEEGLLWYRLNDTWEYVHDVTNTYSEEEGRESLRPTVACDCEYAILVED